MIESDQNSLETENIPLESFNTYTVLKLCVSMTAGKNVVVFLHVSLLITEALQFAWATSLSCVPPRFWNLEAFLLPLIGNILFASYTCTTLLYETSKNFEAVTTTFDFMSYETDKKLLYWTKLFVSWTRGREKSTEIGTWWVFAK